MKFILVLIIFISIQYTLSQVDNTDASEVEFNHTDPQNEEPSTYSYYITGSISDAFYSILVALNNFIATSLEIGPTTQISELIIDYTKNITIVISNLMYQQKVNDAPSDVNVDDRLPEDLIEGEPIEDRSLHSNSESSDSLDSNEILNDSFGETVTKVAQEDVLDSSTEETDQSITVDDVIESSSLFTERLENPTEPFENVVLTTVTPIEIHSEKNAEIYQQSGTEFTEKPISETEKIEEETRHTDSVNDNNDNFNNIDSNNVPTKLLETEESKDDNLRKNLGVSDELNSEFCEGIIKNEEVETFNEKSTEALTVEVTPDSSQHTTTQSDELNRDTSSNQDVSKSNDEITSNK